LQPPRFCVTLTLMFRHSWRTWAFLFLAATLSGVFFATQSYLLYKSYNSKSIPILLLVVLALLQTWTWLLLLPGILAAADRLPLQRRKLLRNVTGHMVIGAAFALVHIALRVVVNSYLPWMRASKSLSFGARFENLFLSSFQSNLLVYCVIVGIYQGLAYYRNLEERERRASQLEARLAEAQLQVLRSQLQPHFLFNTLHAISALVQQDPDRADHAIALLSDLLRMTLECGPEQEVSLQQELEFVQRYLDIEQMRFGDRLTVRLEVPDDIRDACVPSFVLQPMVENAIRHGIAQRSEGGRIEIIAARSNADLELLVLDNGQGFSQAGIREGVGLGNTRARLQQLYGTRGRMTLTQTPGVGASVRLTVPFRTAVFATAPRGVQA
jgi:two-component system LytT family sensor kinase